MKASQLRPIRPPQEMVEQAKSGKSRGLWSRFKSGISKAPGGSSSGRSSRDAGESDVVSTNLRIDYARQPGRTRGVSAADEELIEEFRNKATGNLSDGTIKNAAADLRHLSARLRGPPVSLLRKLLARPTRHRRFPQRQPRRAREPGIGLENKCTDLAHDAGAAKRMAGRLVPTASRNSCDAERGSLGLARRPNPRTCLTSAGAALGNASSPAARASCHSSHPESGSLGLAWATDARTRIAFVREVSIVRHLR
ncbi:hypothetical protein ACVWYQ_003136 [Bradyrhizobium sp. USDA 3397]